MTKEERYADAGRNSLGRTVAWAVIPAFFLLIPLVAMQVTDEVAWTASDFAFAGVLLIGAGVAYALATNWTSNAAHRAAIGLPILGVVLFIWAWAVS